MRLLITLLFSLATFGVSLGKDDDGVNAHAQYKENVKKALENLVKIIDENKMNVTILTSEISHWANLEIKEVKDYSIIMPTNNVQATDSKLTDDKIREWVTAARDPSDTIRTFGRGRVAHIKDGHTESVDKFGPPEEDTGFFETKLYKTITSVKHGEQGLHRENPSFKTYLNFRIPKADGKEENLEIITADLESKIVKKSGSISEDELKAIEKKLRQGFFKYNSAEVMGRVLKDSMNAKFKDNDWQVVMEPGDDFYVPAKKLAVVTVANGKALVYSL